MSDGLGCGRQQLLLTPTEEAVLRELTRHDQHAVAPRLARTYRRMLELSRSEDELDGVGAAHLGRELLSALPGALGIELSSERLEYRSRVDALASSWPEAARRGEPPARTLRLLHALLDEHEAATTRAREGPRALIARVDRARAGHVPEPSLDRWTELSSRGSRLAHRVKAVNRELPGPDDVRRLVDEISATLFGVIAPYFAGIDEIDRLLGLYQPTIDDARAVAALLTTPSRYAYVFERADARWLRPFVGIKGLLSTPPPLIERGDGYVQAPAWPQGRFLARVGGADPDLVEQVVSRIPATRNPVAVHDLVGIARRLPSENAARLVPGLARRMSVSLAVEYAALEAAEFVRELGAAGYIGEAMAVLMSTIDAAMASPRDDDWHLEQVLAAPVATLAPMASDLGDQLRMRLHRQLRASRFRGRYSTLWLRDVDRRPRYGVDRTWHLANALYRTLLAAPLEAGRQVTGVLLSDRQRVMARVALAALAERPELSEDPDDIVGEPGRWDDPASTRTEYRRALGALWPRASEGARMALLAYVETAAEARRAIERLAAEGIGRDPARVLLHWRSRLLFRIREYLPTDCLERLGPIEVIEDDRLPEVVAEWVGPSSPVPEDELAGFAPNALMGLLREWQPASEDPFAGPTLEGLASTAARVVVARFPEFREAGAAFVGLRPRLAEAVTSEVERALREDRIPDRPAGLRFILDLAEESLGADGARDLSPEAKRDVAGVLAHAANEEYLGEQDTVRACVLLEILLHDPDPSPGADERNRGNGYDAGMLALNSVRGAAATAMTELLLASRRAGRADLGETASTMLRHAISTDQSQSVRAAVGLRLPWLLAHDATHQDEWLALLFGKLVSETARAATWEAYLLYGRFFPDTASLLAPQYQAAVSSLHARAAADRGRPLDEDEQLGIHVAMAHLLATRAEADGDWLTEFFARAASWVRARVTRWIAGEAADPEVPDEARSRARAFLEARVASADPGADAEELKAVGWVSSSPDHQLEVLELIVLPALEKSHGAIDNEPGSMGLVAHLASVSPRASARAVQLLVEGDPWRSLPYVAAVELRAGLAQLLSSDIHEARMIAEDVVHTLGAQGFLDFRDLLA